MAGIDYPNHNVRYNVFSSQGTYMVWDWQATYTAQGFTDAGDFVRDDAGKAFVHSKEDAEWIAAEANRTGQEAIEIFY